LVAGEEDILYKAEKTKEELWQKYGSTRSATRKKIQQSNESITKLAIGLKNKKLVQRV